ncbi:sigma-E factor negative regulatory protein [Nitrosomonas sp.]|uniref:sigma-E factor negative regulatory protein n=1 Tax=Nitrosomonas sp. TaxID=42353 RepID=UPI0025F9B4A2|nr:sigma-E factor negative regulatory protein [Nitrosomonas sp.]
MKNKVSELVDGELGDIEAGRVIDAIKDDSDLLADWKIYHAIGDSLRQSAISIDISERVRDRLADEPFLLAAYPHKSHQNRKQKLGSLSIAAAVAVLSVGWLISQSVEQNETSHREMYMANSHTPSAGGRRPSSMTFQPVSAYSSPSMPVSNHYGHYPLVYKDLTYERSARYPVESTSSPAGSAGDHAVSPAE